MTKRENYNAIANILATLENTTDLQTFIAHEIELLDKKAQAPRKKSEKQIEKENFNLEMVKRVYEYLTDHTEGETLGGILKALKVEDYSIQRLSTAVKNYKDTAFTTTKKSGKTIYTAIEGYEFE